MAGKLTAIACSFVRTANYGIVDGIENKWETGIAISNFYGDDYSILVIIDKEGEPIEVQDLYSYTLEAKYGCFSIDAVEKEADK